MLCVTPKHGHYFYSLSVRSLTSLERYYNSNDTTTKVFLDHFVVGIVRLISVVSRAAHRNKKDTFDDGTNAGQASFPSFYA